MEEEDGGREEGGREGGREGREGGEREREGGREGEQERLRIELSLPTPFLQLNIAISITMPTN